MNDKVVYTVADETVAVIARLLQMAIISGVDITDQLRTLRLISVDGKLHPDPEFLNEIEKNLEHMLEVASKQPASSKSYHGVV